MSYAQELVAKRRKAYRDWERERFKHPALTDYKREAELLAELQSLDRRIDNATLTTYH